MADEIFELKGKVSIDTSDLDKIDKSFKSALSSISRSTSQVTDSLKNGGEGLVDFTKGSKQSIKSIEELHKDIEDMGKAVMKNFDNSAYAKKLEARERLTKNFADIMAKAKTEDDFLRPDKGNFGPDVKSAFETPMSKVIGALQKAKEKAKENTKEFSKLFGQFKRIATYRLIRTALKAISGSAKEGVNNLYNYAKLTGDGPFAKAMDSIATSFQYIKNSVGVMLAPVIMALTPVVERLSNAFGVMAEQVGRFFALLTGQNGYYVVATKQAKEYAQAQRQLLGFDELNVLNGNNNTDSSSSFKWQEGFGEMTKFELMIQELGLSVGKTAVENIDKLVIGAALANAVLGTVGLFTLENGVSGVTATLGKIGVILVITGIKTAMEAKGIDEKEFWIGLAAAAAGATAFTYSLLSVLGVATLTAAGLSATVGLVLAVLITKIKLNTSDNAFEEWEASCKAVQEKMFSNKWWERISGFVELMNYNETGVMDFYSNTGSPKTFEDAVIDLTKVKTRADGGPVAKGDLFIAGEAGPELVSGLGGRTQVFNDTQLIGELSVANEGVISAVMQAANAIVSSVSNMPSPTIKIGDRDIYNASKRGSKIVGESLIQGV